MTRKTDFWQHYVGSAVVLTLVVIVVAAVTQAVILEDLLQNNKFRKGFYFSLADIPLENLEGDEKISEGVLLASLLKKIINSDPSEGVVSDDFFEFSDMVGEYYEADVFSKRELIKVFFSASSEEKRKALEEFTIPVSFVKVWQITGLIYWVIFGLVVSMTYFCQCIHGDEDFWRVPYNKLGTYVMILLLFPGLLICLVIWLAIKVLTGDLTNIVPKKEPKEEIDLEVPDIIKAKEDLSRLRERL